MRGHIEDLQALLGQGDEIERLESAILVYLGRLSQVEHAKEEGQQMLDLAQIASNLENVSDVLATNLVSLGQQRIAERIDFARLRDETTSQLANTVTRNLEQAIATISQPSASESAEVIAGKKVIEELATATRKSLFEKLQLADKKDAQSLSLVSNMIEQVKQIAVFARRIAEITREG